MQNCNAVNYDEKVMDGFYDVYGITSNLVVQGKMPLLVELQAVSVLDNVDYEVVLVDRKIDPELRDLENKAYSLSMEYQFADNGAILDGLVQKLAHMVVERMGGPVGDADDMLKRWTIRSYELRSSLNTIILPLGRLDIGLSRHRALLFKVLTFLPTCAGILKLMNASYSFHLRPCLGGSKCENPIGTKNLSIKKVSFSYGLTYLFCFFYLLQVFSNL